MEIFLLKNQQYILQKNWSSLSVPDIDQHASFKNSCWPSSQPSYCMIQQHIKGAYENVDFIENLM